jgi:streptogramin lyase
MRSHATKLCAALGVLGALLVGTGSAAAAPVVDGVFPIGSEVGTNNKIVAGPDGNVWLTVEDGTKDVARVTAAGQVQEFDIEGIETPVGIAPGPDGNLWVTDVEKAARFAPGNPEGTDKSFTVAGIGAGGQVVAGPDGLIWVASGNSLVHFQPSDPTGTVQPVAVEGGLSPKDIDVAGSQIVIADGDEEKKRIVTFSTAGSQLNFPIASGSQGVAGTPSGQIGFSAPTAEPEQVGLITPPNAAQPLPVPGDPFGVAWGPDQAFWVVQFAQGGLTRFAPTGETKFFGGLPLESARQIAPGPNDTLWVTLTKNEAKGVVSSVARVSGLAPDVVVDPLTPAPSPVPSSSSFLTTVAAPETKIDKGPAAVVKTRRKKAKVKFRFSSPGSVAAFQCSLRRVIKKAQLPILTFVPCESPRTYRLRPGRYRFQVRAVLDGVVSDPTPDVRKFRIVRAR